MHQVEARQGQEVLPHRPKVAARLLQDGVLAGAVADAVREEDPTGVLLQAVDASGLLPPGAAPRQVAGQGGAGAGATCAGVLLIQGPVAVIGLPDPPSDAAPA